MAYPYKFCFLVAPDLILIQHMVLVVILAGRCLDNGLWRSMATGACGVGKSTATCERMQCRVRALQAIITKYVPLPVLMFSYLSNRPVVNVPGGAGAEFSDKNRLWQC